MAGPGPWGAGGVSGPTIYRQTATPGSPSSGDIWYHPTTGEKQWYSGSAWLTFDGEWEDVSSSITLLGKTVAGTPTYASRDVFRRLVGKWTHYQGVVNLTGLGGATGTMVLAGFAAASADASSSIGTLVLNPSDAGLGDLHEVLMCQIWASGGVATELLLIAADIATSPPQSRQMVAADIRTNTGFVFSIAYRMA